MNDYYLYKTSKDTTAELIAQADRERLARASKAAASNRTRADRPQRPGRRGGSLSMLFHRVALF